jgi:hypothetical protein
MEKPDSSQNRLSIFNGLLWLVLLFLLSVYPGGSSLMGQSKTKYSIVFDNSTVESAVGKMQKQLGINLFYDTKSLQQETKIINKTFENKPVNEILDYILEGTDLSYKIINNVITIAHKKKQPDKPKIESEGQYVKIKGLVLNVYGSPIEMALVSLPDFNIWGTTDSKGTFSIAKVIAGTTKLQVTCLGYQTLDTLIIIDADNDHMKFRLKEENLKLEEIVVTAKKGSSINSSSKVEKAAIEHVQASSLADVMQLMPGNIIANPSLTTANKVTIRSISTGDENSQRGVGLMINGSRVSTDASMSLEEDSKTANTVDFRNYSTDNIESVEVLKGVLSAEYGNITSGTILVTTKTGETPFEVRIKSDPNTKALALSKGFYLGTKAGSINIDADYARAFKQWISPVNIFNRTTMGITYSNTFNPHKNPFRFNVRVSGYISKNNVTSDPDVSKLDYTKTSDKNLSLAFYGNWLINKSWITSLNYNVSGTYQNNYTKNYTVSSQLPLPTTSTMTSGIGPGTFTDTFNEEDERTEDIPVYANAKVSANLNKKIGNALSKTVFGFEFNTEGNNGRGLYYESGTPQYYRERSYKEVPFLSDLSVFLEDKFNIPVLSETSLELIAGVRVNKMVISGYNYDPTFEPRFNGKYTIISPKKEGRLRFLSFRGGWGILERLPSIVQLYPDPKYLDVPLFQYRNTETGEQLAIIQTSVIDEKLSYNLKPVKTTNSEIGIDFNLFGIEAAITYFRENLEDGITPNSSYISESYDYYNTVSSATASPKYENGRVWAKNSSGVYEQVAYKTRQLYKSYTRPDNRGSIKKWGIEYDLNFGKIDAINTSVIVNGSYIRSLSTTPGLSYHYSDISDPIDPTEKLPYVAIFEGGDGQFITLGSGKERLSTNISFVTHLPSIRMIVSLVTQCIWMNNSWNIYDQGGIYKLDSDGYPVYGDYNGKNNKETLYRTPEYYMDHTGHIYDFNDVYWSTTDQNLKTRLSMLILSSNQSYYFKESGFNPYFMANIRITKEIGNLAQFSFYANNFTNSVPILKNKATPNGAGYRNNNTEIYFGAELKLKF